LYDTPPTVSPTEIGRAVVENDVILLAAPNSPLARIDAYRGTQGVMAGTWLRGNCGQPTQVCCGAWGMPIYVCLRLLGPLPGGVSGPSLKTGRFPYTCTLPAGAAALYGLLPVLVPSFWGDLLLKSC
jgi:hypothetical protein